MSIEIRKVDDVPATRPCRYCLGLQDDSVFADFDIDSEGRVFLVRISFDGYGCYEAGATRMKPEMSRRWIELVETDNVGSVEMSDSPPYEGGVPEALRGRGGSLRRHLRPDNLGRSQQ